MSSNASEPVNIAKLRSDSDSVQIEGDLYRVAEGIARELSANQGADVAYVVRLAISLLDAAKGKDITFTDPNTGQYEEYRLWQSPTNR